MSTATNRIIKNTSYLYIKMAITVLASLYSTRLILNELGTVDFGVFGIVGGAIAMLGFLNGAMSSATQRFISYYQGQNNLEKIKSVFTNSVVLHLCAGVLVFTLLEISGVPLFNGILNIPLDRLYAAKCIFHFAIISTFFTIVSAPYDAIIVSHENMLFYSIIGIVESLLKLSIAFFVVYSLSDKLIVYGLLMALLTVTMLIIKYIYCKLNYSECIVNIKRYYDKTISIELLNFAGWSFVDSMGSLIGNNGTDVVMNHYFGPAINAAGNVGSQLRGQMLAFSNQMLKALNPVIIKREGSGDRNVMLKFSISGAKLSYMLFAILAFPFVIEAPFILKLWLKNVPDWSVCFSRFQMMTALGEQLTITLSTAIAATGMIKQKCIFSGIAHFLPLVLFAFMYANGAQPFWTYLLTFVNFVFVIGGFTLYQCKVKCELNVKAYIFNIIVPCFVCSLFAVLVGVIIVYCFQESMLRLIINFCVINIVFMILSYKILFNIEEKIIMKNLLIKLLRKW